MVRLDYQDLYRMAWEKLTEIDKHKNPAMIKKPEHKGVMNGLKGGRPRQDEGPLETMIRRGVRMDLTYKQIAELAGVSERTIGRKIRQMAWDYRGAGRK
jgi:hypothetical protein